MGGPLIIQCFLLALGQIDDRRFRNVLLAGIGLTLALLIAVTVVFVWLVSAWLGDGISLPFVGEVTWFDDVLGWGSALLMLVLSVFLMVPVASAITSMFLETVAQAVEDKHYPALSPATPISFSDGLRDTIGFLGVMLLANLLALVLYFTPLAPFVFWGLNGFLLGREYFTLAAMRRVGRAQAKVLRRRYFLTIWAAGVLMAIPLSVPLLNLVIPIVGAATFTHLFHRLQAEAPSG